MTMGNRIAAYRKALNITQEALAQKLGVTNQAVSKWESDQCCPDINLLPKLADIFGVTIDELFGREAPAPAPEPEEPVVEEPEAEAQPGEEPTPGEKLFGFDIEKLIGSSLKRAKEISQRAQEIGRQASESAQKHFKEAAQTGADQAREVPLPEDVEVNWEDDDTLRVAIFVGKKLIAGHPARGKIEFCYEGPALNIVSECSVACGSVEGSVRAGGDVDCDDVSGNVWAGGDVTCDDVSGNVQSGGDVTCDDVNGDVTASGCVTCDTVDGSVRAGGDVTCDEVCGNVSAGGDVTCDEVTGSITAGGNVQVG